ncbi:hypothetical protein LTR53_000995 [Teratosphaeriaceae sp. CCFEE 6253]|nr:hypothetical protein LTR53_000995 [Teratosphaeriaceae sp. CCFEE 6253]
MADSAPADRDAQQAAQAPKGDSSVAHEKLTPVESGSPTTPTSSSTGGFPKLRSALRRERQRRSDPIWRPSLLSIRPLLGLLALGISVGCMFVSLAILLVSHNQPVSNWPVQPTVYLAIVTAAANAAIGFARYNAVPISWWSNVARGNTIEELERQWEAGHSVLLALRQHYRMGFTGITTLLVALMIIDGPLLQRSTTVGAATTTKDVTLDLRLTPELPTGFSGFATYRVLTTSGSANRVTEDWRSRAPINLDMPPCDGACAATVHAPGLIMTNCTSQSWPLTEADMYNPNATWGNWRGQMIDKAGSVLHANPFLFIDMTYYPPQYPRRSEVVVLEVGALNVGPSADGFTGAYVDTKCYYVPGILAYNLQIKGTEVTIAKAANQSRPVAVANNTHSLTFDVPASEAQPNTMDALTLYLNSFVATNVSLYMAPVAAPGNSWSMLSISPEYASEAVARYLNYSAPDPGWQLADPTPDIIADMNELLFRAGVLSSSWENATSLIDPGLAVNQSVPGRQTQTENVYRSNLRWFAGAAVLEMVAVLVVLPLFWGWWSLGKVALLSPVELALAFDAPLLRDVNSATGSAGVIGHLGGVRVQYGAMSDGVHGEGPASSSGESVRASVAFRLGIGESANVFRPHKGMRFDI